MNVADLFALLGLKVDDGSFKRGQAALDKLRGLVVKTTAVIAGATAGMAVLVNQTRAAGDAADKTSRSLGITAREFQELAYAAESSGLKVDQLRPALNTLIKNAESAAYGNKEMAATFRWLGVATTDASGKLRQPIALLEAVANGLTGVGDESERLVVAQKLLGESGARMVNMLDGGAAGLRALRGEAHAFGAVLDDGAVAASVALTDSLGRLKSAGVGLRNLLTTPLLVPLRRVVDAMVAWWVANRALLGQRMDQMFRRLAPVAAAMAAAVGGISRAFTSLLGDEQKLRAALVGLAAVGIGSTIKAFAALGRAGIAAAVKMTAGWAAATLPFLLLGAAIALLADDVYGFVTGGESLLGDFLYLIEDVWGRVVAGLLGLWAIIRARAIVHAARIAAAWVASAATRLASEVWLAAQVAAITVGYVAKQVAAAGRVALAWAASGVRVLAGWAAQGAAAAAQAGVASAAWLTSAAASGAAWVATAAAAIPAMVATGASAIAAGASAAAAWIAATWPILLLIGILGIVAYEIYKFATKGEGFISDFIYAVGELWELLKETAGAAWEWVKEKAGAAWDWMGEKATGFVDTVKEAFGRVKDAIVGAFKDAFQAAIELAPGPIGALLKGATKLKDALSGDSDIGVTAQGVISTAAQPGSLNARFGGGASPGAAARTSNINSRTANLSVTNDVRVNVPPGTPPEQVGRIVADASTDAFGRAMSDAAAVMGA